jgi:hypothetical protein
MSRSRVGATVGDLWKVLAAMIGSLGFGLLADGAPRVFFVGLGAGLLYVFLFLLLGELAWGRDGLHLWSRPEAEPPRELHSPVLQVMRRVMHVRPEPFSGATADRNGGRPAPPRPSG